MDKFFTEVNKALWNLLQIFVMLPHTDKLSFDISP